VEQQGEGKKYGRTVIRKEYEGTKKKQQHQHTLLQGIPDPNITQIIIINSFSSASSTFSNGGE
jgi:hypothetical protein